MWWTAATNLGVSYAMQQRDIMHILTLNNDLVLTPTYIDEMLTFADKHPNSVIGSISRSISNPEIISFAGIKWNKWTAKYKVAVITSKLDPEMIIYSDLLPGRGTLIPKEAFESIGFYDEKKFPHYISDEDFSLQCKKVGYKLLLSPKIFVLSEIEATGLYNIHKDKSFHYWRDLFLSIRSPVNLRNKWNWAWKNTPIPPVYFSIDMARIILSKVFKS